MGKQQVEENLPFVKGFGHFRSRRGIGHGKTIGLAGRQFLPAIFAILGIVGEHFAGVVSAHRAAVLVLAAEIAWHVAHAFVTAKPAIRFGA